MNRIIVETPCEHSVHRWGNTNADCLDSKRELSEFSQEAIEAAARWAHNEMGKRSGVGLTWEAAYPSEQADYLNIAGHMLAAALEAERNR